MAAFSGSIRNQSLARQQPRSGNATVMSWQGADLSLLISSLTQRRYIYTFIIELYDRLSAKCQDRAKYAVSECTGNEGRNIPARKLPRLFRDKCTKFGQSYRDSKSERNPSKL